MSNFKIYEFHPQVYPRRLWVAVGGNEKDVKSLFRQPDGTELELDVDSSLAVTSCVMTNDRNNYLGELVWFVSVKDLTASNIAHEAVHAAMDIFVDLGCRFDAFNQEPFAYLVGWVADCIDKVKRNKVE
jgi:hypothetical protein